MSLRNWIGEAFRSYTGMPHKASTYDAKIDIYDEIVKDIDEIENSTITFFEETYYMEWMLNKANRIKLESDLKNSIITSHEYVEDLNRLEEEAQIIVGNFVDTTDEYFVTAYRNRLYTVKKTNKNQYIDLMDFDTWIDMKQARDIAKTLLLSIKTNNDYIVSKKIAEIVDKYRKEKHLRRGR